MRILFLVQSLDRGGAERQLVALASGLRERGHDVAVAVFYGGGAFEGDLVAAGVRLVDLSKRRRWDVVTPLARLVALVRRERPDVVHGYLVVPNLLTILVKICVPRTRILWGVRHAALDWREFDWFIRATEAAGRRLARFADVVVVNSEAGFRHHLDQGYPGGRMVVVPNGIDTARFRPDSAARARVRREWGIGDGDRLVGMVARVDVTKDHRSFLEAAVAIAATRGDVRFVCVGAASESERAELVRRAGGDRLGDRLRWTGGRADMPELYSALDVCCLASLTEGFPNVVGEAMACGVPCVVTDVGDAAAVVGPTGVVVPPGSAAALADGLRAMLDRLDREPRLGCAARERVEQHFPLQAMVERTASILTGLS